MSDVFWIIEALWQLMSAAQWQEAYIVLVEERLLNDLDRWGSYTTLLEVNQAFLSQEVWSLSSEQRALISNSAGVSYQMLGRMQDALDYYQYALTLYQKVGDHLGEGATLNNIGTVYNGLKKKQKALDYYEQALALSREVGDRSGEGAILNNMGHIYDGLGQEQEALKYYEQALALHREVGNRSGEGRTLNNMGHVYDALGKRQEALNSYQQALEVSREAGDHSGEGATLNNMGRSCNALGKKQEALGLYWQALALFREVGNRFGEGITLNNIGSLFLSQQCHKPAMAALLLAQHILKVNRSPYQNAVQGWMDDLRKEIGDEAFVALQACVEPQAEQILEQTLHHGMIANEIIERAFLHSKERTFLSSKK